MSEYVECLHPCQCVTNSQFYEAMAGKNESNFFCFPRCENRRPYWMEPKQNRIGNVQANCELFEHRTSVYKEYLIIRYLFSLITQNYLPSFQEIRNETTLLADIQEPRSKTFSKQLRRTSHFVLLNVTNGTFASDGLFICRDYSQNFKAIYLFSSRQMVHSWVARVDLVTPGSKISTHSKQMYE